MNVPDEMKDAQQNLLLALQMRRDGIANIGQQIQPALGTTTSKDAVNRIAAEMARFYASDVVYKDYAVPLMIGALKSAGIAVGGANGVPIESGQFLTNLGWLTPELRRQPSSARRLRRRQAASPPRARTGTRSTRSASAAPRFRAARPNTLPASPPPTFTFHFTNSGQNTEHNVILKVTIGGTNLTAQTTVAADDRRPVDDRPGRAPLLTAGRAPTRSRRRLSRSPGRRTPRTTPRPSRSRSSSSERAARGARACRTPGRGSQARDLEADATLSERYPYRGCTT